MMCQGETAVAMIDQIRTVAKYRLHSKIETASPARVQVALHKNPDFSPVLCRRGFCTKRLGQLFKAFLYILLILPKYYKVYV